MRVLLTADTAGGVWTYACALARGLNARGVKTVIAAMGRAPRPADGLDVRFARFALEWEPEPWADVEQAGEWLLELADDVEPDVVHVNGYAHAALDWGAPVVCVGHSDVLGWLEAVRGERSASGWDRYRDEVAAGLAAADVVVAPTLAQLRSLQRHYGLEKDGVVVANGLRPLSPRPKQPLIAGAGRAWDEAKGLAALAQLELPWPIQIADGSWSQERTNELLGRAAVFAAPAKYEPFGLAALEAASTGAALVLGNIASLREVWGDAAVYVSDERELETALRCLIANEQLRHDYGARARRRARCFTAERMTDAYVGLYARLPVRFR